MLEKWMDSLATKLREDIEVEIAATDKLVGGVIELLINIDGAHCEIIAVRSKKKHAHVAVFAEREAAAKRLAELLGFAYRGIGRFQNAERKLVHRIERCAKSLAAGWAKQIDAFPAEPLARIGETVPDAHAMCGRGYHVHVAGAEDDDDKHRYDPLYAVSVPAGGRRRALVYQPAKRQFVAPTALVALLPPAAIAAGAVAADDRMTTGDMVLEATSEVCCELPEFIPDLGGCDVGDCVPDCGSFDIPDCDIGGCDLG
jgi:hypothetical protein